MVRFSVHQTLGGGSVADVLLWKRYGSSIGILISSTAFWYLFECAGYNLLTFILNVLLFLVVVLFLWAKSASLLNRPLPPLPHLEVSEEAFVKTADVMRIRINQALLIVKEIAVHRDLRRLLQVGLILWLVSFIGSFFNLLTLLYVGVLICLFVPLAYDKYQDRIEDRLIERLANALATYRTIEDIVVKIQMSFNKEKKTQ